jgi:hypothetical protein
MTRNMGREDRLVRGGITLSLALMGGFAVLASGAVGAGAVTFAVLGAYLLLTATLGWDPAYARIGMDTRRPDQAGGGPDGSWQDPWPGETEWPEPDAPAEADVRGREIDLRDGVAHAPDRRDNS